MMEEVAVSPEGSSKAPRVSFWTLGCRLNQHDTAALRARLLDSGLVEARAGDGGAGVIFVNTCTVTRRADQEARQLIRKIHRASPGARIVVTGCYAQRAPEELKGLPGVTAVLGSAERDDPEMLLRAASWGGPHAAGASGAASDAAAVADTIASGSPRSSPTRWDRSWRSGSARRPGSAATSTFPSRADRTGPPRDAPRVHERGVRGASRAGPGKRARRDRSGRDRGLPGGRRGRVRRDPPLSRGRAGHLPSRVPLLPEARNRGGADGPGHIRRPDPRALGDAARARRGEGRRVPPLPRRFHASRRLGVRARAPRSDLHERSLRAGGARPRPRITAWNSGCIDCGGGRRAAPRRAHGPKRRPRNRFGAYGHRPVDPPPPCRYSRDRTRSRSTHRRRPSCGFSRIWPGS